MTDAWALLRPLERIETLMAEIYETFTTSFAADSAAARLFGRLALDERNHASQVQYIHRIARQHPHAFDDVPIELSGVRRTLDDLETLQSAAARLALPDAVALSVGVERSAAETHGRAALAHAARDLARLLESLTRGDHDHVAALVGFAAARGFPVPPSPSDAATDGDSDVRP
jgi:hypothetical protein